MATKKPSKPKTKADSVSVFILLDRSGSMGSKWIETLGALNGYVEKLGNDKTGESHVTLATFHWTDSLAFDVIRDNVTSAEWEKVVHGEAPPGGYTPLFDAIGRIVNLADKKNDNRTVIAIITDGEENSSRELSREAAGRLFDKCKGKGWQVVFLGADFDAFNQASSVGINRSMTINTSAVNLGATMDSLVSNTMSYRASGQSMAWSDEDREKANGKKGA